MGLLLIALALIEFPLSRLVQLRSPAPPLTMLPWHEIAAFGASFFVCCWFPMPRLLDAAKATMWGGLFANPLAFLVQIAGRSRFGLVDRQLASIDGHMYISTAMIHLTVNRSLTLMTSSILIYVLFIPLLTVAVVLPCLYGHRDASHRFILGVVIGVILGSALFVVLPAAGPWMTEGMRPSLIQATMTDYLLRLKSGLPMKAEMAHAAIISFPSEHVIVALLGANAIAAIYRLRRPAWILGTLICLSTLTTGWHYAIDILGGLVVAWLSRGLAAWICDRLSGPNWLTNAGVTDKEVEALLGQSSQRL